MSETDAVKKVNEQKIKMFTDALESGKETLANIVIWEEQGEHRTYEALLYYLKTKKIGEDALPVITGLRDLSKNNLTIMRDLRISNEKSKKDKEEKK